ncbi:helix-turn-helix domain-containing protein [Rhizobium leguminosarum]|uniref:Helix-turn-helix domain-containing protein n=1 Tax=Rhizobium ruizarguesonis TaxID=2081791 RepID=A0AAE5C685_9HYPH|nr:helix-turn-helix transcriptional regulator [Rhizobium ruizarguesonis]NEI52665.1 helix-turn-helix domain-containing protein [Rhizobium ruizarguesonis]
MAAANERAELAKAVRAWRDGNGLTVKQAADLLGMSRRTFEGIEQGRGFSYPAMLKIAMEAKKGADNA